MNDFTQAKATFTQNLASDSHPFADTLAFVEQWFDFQPSGFDNGNLRNEIDQNQGSCRVLSMAKLIGLSNEQALQCFGEHYRDVVATPEGDSHQNIRQLQQHGLDGVSFDTFPLVQK